MKLLKILFLCRWVRSRLLLYFGGETTAADTREITEHLGKCAHCSQYSRKLSGVNNLVEECMRKDKTLPPELAEKVMERVRTGS